MKKVLLFMAFILGACVVEAKTLIAYYSYTNNVERIINGLRTRIEADVVEIEPAEKGLDYAANNYAIGSAQIAAIRENPENADSYPAIDRIDINFDDYDCIIIGTPLWWSNIAAPMQTFLFQHGAEMSGKNIGLIVSSASSGISGVEADAKRLIPNGNFMSESLWIRSSQTSNAAAMLENWLKAIRYDELVAGISAVYDDITGYFTVYSLNGTRMQTAENSFDNLPAGIYIINGEKRMISK